jgi:hypothetical protein
VESLRRINLRVHPWVDASGSGRPYRGSRTSPEPKEKEMSGVLEVLVGIGLVGLMIVAQVKGQALRGRRVILLPAVLLAIGVSGLSGLHSMTTTDLAFWARPPSSP